MKTVLKSLLLFFAFTTSCFAQLDDQFYFPSKKLKPLEFLDYEKVPVLVENDTLQNIFLKPKGKVKATIVFFQGNGGNYTHYQSVTKPLVEEGYQVFMVSFRGYGESSGKPTHLNIASDSEKVFEYITKREDVKNTKIIVYGTSIGCQIATNFTRKYQSRISGLVLDSGFASFTDIALSTRPAEQHQFIKMYVKSPYASKEDIKFIEKVKLLVIQSKSDKVAPFEQGVLVFDNAKTSKKLLEYNGEHIEAMKTDSKAILVAINDLL